ncbi:hypothetical protein T4D_4941 [Trichinella pseudospiralis]|uniref:Uncharacterized protein n=1 Tax=Trichinella pseudospiralis TaxID=6337 RepID=A0A0V1FYF2_TRIPS|nr:hypothetical protein T4D_4941 [Trichinella pseudospiralis]
MLYSTATRKPPPHQRRRPLTLEEYGYIDGFLMSIQFEKKRLAQTLRSQLKMYIIVNTYTAPSMSTMVTSSATPSTSQYQVPQLNMHQYGFIDSFLIKMHYERKRLAQISNYAVATTPSYHIHCQGCHQQWTPPTVIHCRSYTPEARYLFQ